MRNTGFKIFSFLIIGLFATSCSTSTGSDTSTLHNQSGELIWGGSPATDGVGILFETENHVYGAPGSKEDYDEFFIEGENRAFILADITITGDSVMRGWGTKFPEIQFIKLERVD